MTWWMPHNFELKKQALKQRGKITQALRYWFAQQDVDEVVTPALQVTPVMDTHIHGFATKLLEPDLTTAHDMYLHTSPEFAMKKLLVAGMQRIYQLCPVYRNGDDSQLHSPEFMLLEWYRTQTDYTAMMDDCEGLIQACAQAVDVAVITFNGIECDITRPFTRLSLRDAFSEYADIDLDNVLGDTQAFKHAASAKGIRVADDDQWDDVFFRVMADKIEPTLGQGQGTILYDYPVCMASLSRKKEGDPRYAERFELYLCGVEIANAFSELTDAAEQRTRFENDMKAKQAIYGSAYPLDEDFLAALEYGLPQSSGCALGFDRLVMLLTGSAALADVIWAPVTPPVTSN